MSTVSGPGRPAAAAIDACKKLASRKLKLGFLNFDIDICVVITFRAKGVPIHCTLCSKFPEFPYRNLVFYTAGMVLVGG